MLIRWDLIPFESINCSSSTVEMNMIKCERMRPDQFDGISSRSMGFTLI